MRYYDAFYEESSEGAWFLTPEGIILTAITFVFLLIITRILQKPAAEDISWGKLLAAAYAISLLVSFPTILSMSAFSIPLDQFIPTYCIVFWIGYGLLNLYDKWESWQEKKRIKNIPTPPAKPRPRPKNHDNIQFSIRR